MGAEAHVTVLAKDLGDAVARFLADGVIEIDEGRAQTLADHLSNSGFPRAGEADDGNMAALAAAVGARFGHRQNPSKAARYRL